MSISSPLMITRMLFIGLSLAFWAAAADMEHAAARARAAALDA
jgi:hypothetical protein